MSRIVAVDPGNMSGIVVAEFLLLGDPEIICVEELPPMETVALAEMHVKLGAKAVACENYIPRPGRKTWQPDALHIIGGLRYVCWRAGVKLELQAVQKNTDRAFADNRKLDIMGWRKKTKDDHADDAFRQLLVYAVDNGYVDAGRFL